MKNPEINIVKKMSPEQKKLLFFAPMGLIIFIISGYVLFADDGKRKKKEETQITNNWELPGDSQKDIPSSVLEVHDQLDKHNIKTAHHANNSDFFEDLSHVNVSKTTPNENRALDSLNNNKELMYNKIQEQLKSLNSNPPVRNQSNNRETRHRKVEEVEIEKDIEPENTIDINDFFKNKARSKTSGKAVNLGAMETIRIKAVVHNDQIIKNKGRIKLRLVEAIAFNGIKHQKNSFIYGFARFNNNRVFVTVKSINNQHVNLECYDTSDGEKGIYIEGANTIGEISKEGSDDAISDIDASDVPLGNTVKNIFRKKNREKTVFLQNNYNVILK